MNRKLRTAAAFIGALAVVLLLVACTSTQASSKQSGSGTASSSSTAASSTAASAAASSQASAPQPASSASPIQSTAEGATYAVKPTEPAPSRDSSYDDVLIVGVDPDRLPYTASIGDGSYGGFDLEVLQAVCEINGWALEVVPIDWSQRDLVLANGWVDCICGDLYASATPAESVLTEPYLSVDQVFLTRTNSGIDSTEGLSDALVATENGSAAMVLLDADDSIAETFAGGMAQAEPSLYDAFYQLENSEFDALACDTAFGNSKVIAAGGAIQMLPGSLGTGQLVMAFAAGKDDRAAATTQALRKIYEDGIAQNICASYAAYGLSADNWLLR